MAAAGAASAAETGVYAAAFGTGRVSVVAREDLADVAVRVTAETSRDLLAGGRSRHADKVYELEGIATIGGLDIAEVLTELLGRSVDYRTMSLFDTRIALQHLGMEPYQITNALSLFANIGAGVLEASHTDLFELLPTEPRDVRALITGAVQAGGYQSISVDATR